MTNVKISDLPAKTTLDGGEELVYAEGGDNGKIELNTVKTFVQPTIDTEMSDESENAVQNKVVKGYIDGKVTTKSSTQPENPTAGDQWYNTSDGKLYLYNGESWEEIGAGGGGGGDYQETQYRTDTVLEAPADSVAAPLTTFSSDGICCVIKDDARTISTYILDEAYNTETKTLKSTLEIPFDVKGVLVPGVSGDTIFKRAIIVYGEDDIQSYYINPSASTPNDTFDFSNAIETDFATFDPNRRSMPSIKSTLNIHTATWNEIYSYSDENAKDDGKILGQSDSRNDSYLIVGFDSTLDGGDCSSYGTISATSGGLIGIYRSDVGIAGNNYTWNSYSSEYGYTHMVGITEMYSHWTNNTYNCYAKRSNGEGYVIYGLDGQYSGGLPYNMSDSNNWNKFNDEITSPFWYMGVELQYYNNLKYYISDERYMGYKMLDKMGNIYLKRNELCNDIDSSGDKAYSTNYVNNLLNRKQNIIKYTTENAGKKVISDTLPYVADVFGTFDSTISYVDSGNKYFSYNGYTLKVGTCATPYAVTPEEYENPISAISDNIGNSVIMTDDGYHVIGSNGSEIKVMTLTNPFSFSETSGYSYTRGDNTARIFEETGIYFWEYDSANDQWLKYETTIPFNFDVDNINVVDLINNPFPNNPDYSLNYGEPWFVFSPDGTYIAGLWGNINYNMNYIGIYKLDVAFDLTTIDLSSRIPFDFGPFIGSIQWMKLGRPNINLSQIYYSAYGLDVTGGWATYMIKCKMDKTQLYPSWAQTINAIADKTAPVNVIPTSNITINDLFITFTPDQNFTLSAPASETLLGITYRVLINSDSTAYTMTLDGTINNPFGETLTLTANKKTLIELISITPGELMILSVKTEQ